MSASEAILKVETEGGVQRVTMNRPDRLNALDHPSAEGLLRHFEGLRRNTDIRVVIVAGAGRGFSAGADLKAGGTPDALRDGPNGDWTLRDLMKAMRGCPQPIISLVRGPCAGGGLAIALASDIIVASETARFISAFIGVGLSGAELGVGWRLQRAVGLSKAREMLLANRPMNAPDALTAGLVSAVVPDGELDAYGAALAADMLKARPDALRLTKRTLDAVLEIGSYDAAMELEERAQMIMIAKRGG